jgi:hypothetical protein
VKSLPKSSAHFDGVAILRFLYCQLLAALLLSLPISDLRAQESSAEGFQRPGDQEPAHWALASVIGTGWYQLEGGRSAFILTVPPRQVLRESGMDDAGNRQIGIFLTYDTAIGFYNIDHIPEIIDSDNFSTASFTPGVEIEIPISPDWYIRAYANLGWGTSFGEGASAWIYYAGVKSRYLFGGSDRKWALLNGVSYAGLKPESGSSNSIAGLFTGIEYSHVFAESRRVDTSHMLHWQLGYTFVDEAIDIITRDGTLRSIGNTAEIGLAISRPDQPYRLWILNFDRLGLTYTLDSNGKFKSITLNFTSWFEK